MMPFWRITQSELMLAEKDLHIWRADLDLPIIGFQKLYQTLSVDERVRAKRFHFEKDRRRFIVGRGILRMVLSCYLSVEPYQLQFCYGKNGKPALADTFGKGSILFNMSDSEGLALYAFARDHEIGVDIEHIRYIPEMDQIAEQYFSARENAVFRSLPESKKREAFFSFWTRKEAFMKAKGEGLGLGLNQVEVSLTPGEQATLLSVNSNPQEASRWSLQDLDPGPGFTAALAVQGHGCQLKSCQWEGGDYVERKANDSHYTASYLAERLYREVHVICLYKGTSEI
jgi:4'-phosphopantetheinyl transferase